jgi:hypothetical protein
MAQAFAHIHCGPGVEAIIAGQVTLGRGTPR